jgi:hypothetical protein
MDIEKEVLENSTGLSSGLGNEVENAESYFENEIDIQREWKALLTNLKDLLGKEPDLNGVLFLIGVQELGMGLKQFTKEEKQDLMHWAICKVLSLSGFYEPIGKDETGWVHWKPTKKLPYLDLLTQEKLLQEHVIMYFKIEIFK